MPDSKFRLQLSTDVEDADGNALDGEWSNLSNGTLDKFGDDPSGRTFLTGNGVPGVAVGEFQFLFSLLAGDRNQDGVVTTADQGVSGDVDGDGDNDAADTTLVTSALSNDLQLRRNVGDYLDDDLNDIDDYLLWKFTYGSTTDLRADGNGDGVVDAADYLVWRNNLGEISAWSTESVVAGLSFPVVQVGAAPQVTNVVVSGSQSAHSPYSFDTVDGSGEQLRTVPVGGADTISITFSEDVNVMESDLSLAGMTTGHRPTLAEFDYDVSTMTATWRFTGWTIGDNYLLSLKDTITDVEGDCLDGEWTNPETLTTVNSSVSEFPSGDGTMGGAFNFALSILRGDGDLDGVVTLADLFLVQNNFGLTGQPFSSGDYNGDGAVSGFDLNIVMTNFGTSIQTLWLRGDLDGDFDIDQNDISTINANFGMSSPTYADGDLDGDGDVDIDDLDFAFAQFGMELEVV